MSDSIQYKYAKDSNGTIIDIEDLKDERDRKDYECLSCKKILRPVLPKKNGRQKHFRHKRVVDCDGETYLHMAAKHLFMQIYQECIEKNIPFEFEFNGPQECSYCLDLGGASCSLPKRSIRYNLINKFTEIKEEKRYNVSFGEKTSIFQPDARIISDSDGSIFIEIHVTSKVSQKKKDSKERIIEITFRKEEDLQLIVNRLINENDERIKLYNFNPKIIKGDFSNKCNKSANYFIVSREGKCREAYVKYFDYLRACRTKPLYIKKIFDRTCFRIELYHAIATGLKIQSCFLCKYHETLHSSDHNLNICCLFHGRNKHSDIALECKKFEFDKKYLSYSANYNKARNSL